MLLWQVQGELSLILLKKVEVEHFINEMIHKPNVLRFWAKVRCSTHLYGYFEHPLEIQRCVWLCAIIDCKCTPPINFDHIHFKCDWYAVTRLCYAQFINLKPILIRLNMCDCRITIAHNTNSIDYLISHKSFLCTILIGASISNVPSTLSTSNNS
jgi:hypothetical protein